MTAEERIDKLINDSYTKQRLNWIDGRKNNYFEWEEMKEKWEHFQQMERNYLRVCRELMIIKDYAKKMDIYLPLDE